MQDPRTLNGRLGAPVPRFPAYGDPHHYRATHHHDPDRHPDEAAILSLASIYDQPGGPVMLTAWDAEQGMLRVILIALAEHADETGQPRPARMRRTSNRSLLIDGTPQHTLWMRGEGTGLHITQVADVIITVTAPSSLNPPAVELVESPLRTHPTSGGRPRTR